MRRDLPDKASMPRPTLLEWTLLPWHTRPSPSLRRPVSRSFPPSGKSSRRFSRRAPAVPMALPARGDFPVAHARSARERLRFWRANLPGRSAAPRFSRGVFSPTRELPRCARDRSRHWSERSRILRDRPRFQRERPRFLCEQGRRGQSRPRSRRGVSTAGANAHATRVPSHAAGENVHGSCAVVWSARENVLTARENLLAFGENALSFSENVLAAGVNAHAFGQALSLRPGAAMVLR